MAIQPKVQAPWGEYIPHVGPMTVEQFEQFPGEEGWMYELSGSPNAPSSSYRRSDTITGAPVFRTFQCPVQDILRP